MTRLGNKAVIALAVFGLFVGSGIALADSHVEDGNDTVFNYGYDEDNSFFMWNVTSLEFDENYESIDDLQQCKLQPEGDTIVYEYEAGESISLKVKGGDPIDFVELGCADPVGGTVIGPDQHLNHGRFLKLFNEMYEGNGGRGCLVRQIAQSDLGKVDHTDDLAEGEISFTSVETDCVKGKKGDEDGTRGGPPAHIVEKKALKQAEKWGEGGKPGKGPKNGD